MNKWIFSIGLLACAVVGPPKLGWAAEAAPPQCAQIPQPMAVACSVCSTEIAGTSFTFVSITRGHFRMGSDMGEGDFQPAHPVDFTYDFLLSQTEVTQGQWRAVMGDNPSHFNQCGIDCPVDSVSYDDVQRFIKRLNTLTGKNEYRLPSEAEWEYACRAGTTNKFCGDSDINKVAWYDGNSGGETSRVHQKNSIPIEQNKGELFDMTGNVAEWVQDYYHDSYEGAPTKGGAWNTAGKGRNGSAHVLRGGSWHSLPHQASATYRAFDVSTARKNIYGFRLAKTLEPAVVEKSCEKNKPATTDKTETHKKDAP